MAKSSSNSRNSNESRSQSQPRIPSGHFNSDGQSNGKQNGPVRPTPDANNERKEK